MLSKIERDRIEKNVRNDEIVRKLKDEVPYFTIPKPRKRASTVLDREFADELLKYVDKHSSYSSRSELIEDVLKKWWEGEGVLKI